MSPFLPSIASTLRRIAFSTLVNRSGHCLRCERVTAWVVDLEVSGYRCTSCGHDAVQHDA